MTDDEQEQLLPPALPLPRFIFPGTCTTIHADGDLLPIDRLVTIVLHLAAAEPNCKVDFWIKVRGEDG